VTLGRKFRYKSSFGLFWLLTTVKTLKMTAFPGPWLHCKGWGGSLRRTDGTDALKRPVSQLIAFCIYES